MSRGRHARDGQRRDALSAWLATLRQAARDTRALIRLIPVIPMIVRRAHPRAAAGPAPLGRTVQAPRPADPPSRRAARCGPGQPLPEQPHLPGCDGQCGGLAAHQAHLDDGGCPCCYCAQYAVPQAPGAVAAGTGTSAGATPSPAAAATTPPGGAAQLPPPVPPRESPGRGQHLPWVITQPPPGSPAGYMPVPRYRGDYRPTAPMRAAGPAAVSVVRPFYPAAEARRDSTGRWGT